jgi:histidine ammonia-lyase
MRPANPRSAHEAARAVVLDGSALSPGQVEAVARGNAAVGLAPGAEKAIASSRAIVEGHLTDGHAHYGINTGFGSLSRQRIPADQLRALQVNLVRSHGAGVGPPLPRDVVRAMMLLLAASLARATSGVRVGVVERLLALLNAGITPWVPEVGSVGASGDLAPLAHVALVLIGEGWVRESETSHARAEAGPPLRRAGIAPLALEAKEGLALINGTHLMAAQGALLVRDAERLADAALLACAMMIDACRATDAFLDERIYHARNQPGCSVAAARLRGALAGSEIVPAHRENDPRVQDPYSLRCAPAVLGAALDALAYAQGAIERELGAVTDNPLVFGGAGDAPAILSAGNFHGMPLAIPLDTVAIALSHIAGISERRTYFLLAATDPQNPVPAYLSPTPGLHSGLMIAQYTAAACVNEMIGLAGPASVANIPTSAGVEDYNSFGPRSAAKARRSLELCTRVIAIELLCAAEAIEYQRPLRSGGAVERAHAVVRSVVPRLTADRPPSPDIEAVAGLIASGAFSG